jgi:hypothetical protein
MKMLAGVLLLLGTTALADDPPDSETPKGKGHREVVVSLAHTPKEVAAQIKVGMVIDLVIEEPAPSPARTIFPAKRVLAMAQDKRKKDGHTVSVNLSAAQAQAFDIFKAAGTVSVQLHNPGARAGRSGDH